MSGVVVVVVVALVVGQCLKRCLRAMRRRAMSCTRLELGEGVGGEYGSRRAVVLGVSRVVALLKVVVVVAVVVGGGSCVRNRCRRSGGNW